MSLLSCFSRWRKSLQSARRPRAARARVSVEELEGRITPSVMFTPKHATSAGGPVVNHPAGLVANGNFQNFAVTNGQLTVTGDQAGSSYDDTILIDVNAGGGVSVNLDGQVMNFNFGQITSVVVNTGVGSNSVFVNNEASGVPLTINEGGNDFVQIGANGSVQGVRGSVSLSNPSYYTNLVIDDTADTVGRTVSVNSTSVVGLAPAGIFFHYNDLSYLTIYGGSGGNRFNVLSTPSTYTGSYAGYTWISSGAGSDTVNITGTAATLSVFNDGGLDNVHIGNGTLAGISGAVNVSGAGATYLYVDDGSDTSPHSPTLTGTSLTGLSPGTIQWAASKTGTGGVTYLKIAASGVSIVTVADTPDVLYSTDLSVNGGSQVNIRGTTGTLNVSAGAGLDSVYIGDDGELTDILGAVNVSGAGSIQVYIEDGSDPNAHSATLTRNSLTGLSQGAIQWTASAATSGGVTSLQIIGSAAANTYTVTDTPNVHYNVLLLTGAGDDTVYITGTTGVLYVQNGGGADTVVIGRLAPATSGGKVAAVKGFVDVLGGGTVNLTVDDGGDTNGRSATLTGSSLTGLAPAVIYYDANVASLTINGGTGNDTLTLASLPAGTVTFNGGNGGDRLVGPNTSTYWDITGIAAGNVAGNLNFLSVENLVGGTAVDTFWFEPGARVSGINGGGAPAGQGDWLDYANYSAAVTVNLATGKATGVSGAISNIQNVFGGNFGNTLTGNAQGNILIGGVGADTITGGTGRSLLIGGQGSDTVKGGSGDDIVIGGDTAYRSAYREAALMSILAEWQSADSYATRISKLRSSYNPPLALGTTVFDDGAADKLTGGAGMDWLFAGSLDTITDYQGGEVVN